MLNFLVILLSFITTTNFLVLGVLNNSSCISDMDVLFLIPIVMINHTHKSVLRKLLIVAASADPFKVQSTCRKSEIFKCVLIFILLLIGTCIEVGCGANSSMWCF
ncbi:hypothetical protein S245_014157 [Arachis hypogaea]